MTDIETTGSGSLDIDTGETADTDILGAVYPFDGLAFDVTDTERVAIPAADVDLGLEPERYRDGVRSLVAGVK